MCRCRFWPRRLKSEKISEIHKFKNSDGRHIENHFLAITLLHGVWRHNCMRTKFRWWKCPISKIQYGLRPPFWKSLYLHISAANCANYTKFNIRTQILSQATETWQKNQKSPIQDGGRTPYWKSFLAITRLHRVRLRRNFEFGGIIARARNSGDENVQFRKSNMADGRHFENHYISISQPQIVLIARNLVCRHKFYGMRRKRHKKLEIRKFKWRMELDATLKITFWL